MPIPKDKLDTIFRDPEFRALPNDRKDVLLSKIESSYTSPTQPSDAEPPEQAAPTKKKSLDIPEKIQQITGAPIKTALDVAKTVGGVYEAVKKPVVDLAVKTGPGLQLLSRIPEVNLESPLAQFTPQPIREAIFPKVQITGPKAAQAVGGLGFDAAAIPGIGGAAKGAARVAKGVINKVEGISEYVGMPLSRSLDRIVKTGVMKGVKPTVTGKGTAPKFKAYLDDSRKAVGTIYDNRNSLCLLDEAGQPVKKLPENLQEFSQAIHNTKETVFKKYDALAKQATGQGAEVDLVPLGQDILDNLVKREKVLKAVAPEAIEYAQKRAASLIETGTLNADEAQDAVKTLNASLEAYYRNPSYETGSKATVDAGIASALRKQLDSVIEKATGSQYQALRSAYKSRLTVEKDVARQAVIQGRRAGKGLLDFSDIFSGADVVQGLLRLDPTQVVRGGVMRAISQGIKKANSPDRAVKMMFKNYDKIYRVALSRAKTAERAMPKAPIGRVLKQETPPAKIPTVSKEIQIETPQAPKTKPQAVIEAEQKRAIRNLKHRGQAVAMLEKKIYNGEKLPGNVPEEWINRAKTNVLRRIDAEKQATGKLRNRQKQIRYSIKAEPFL